jgi:hypothetical protein
MSSPERVAANRRNAKKSTGPKSAEGKSASRWNALTHGLSASEVVLPHEDPQEFTTERDAFFQEWKPPTTTRAVLVERLAVSAYRMRRCVRVENQRIAEQIKPLQQAVYDDLYRRCGKAWERLDTEPNTAYAFLSSNFLGIDRLREGWRSILEAAREPGTWNDTELHIRYLRFSGIPRNLDLDPHDAQVIPESIRLIRQNANPASVPEAERISDAESREFLASVRKDAVAELKRLNALYDAARKTDDLEVDVAIRNSIDDSSLGKSVARHEAQHERTFRSALAQLIELEKTGIDLIEGDESSGDQVGSADEPNAAAHVETKQSRPSCGPHGVAFSCERENEIKRR